MKVLSRPVIIVLLFSFIPSPFLLAANPLDVVINEIAWMGTEAEGIESKNWWRYEWLELYNDTGQTLSLEGWKIELYRDSLDWSLGLKGNILAQDYFLIVASDKIFPNYDLNYSNLGGKFNNSGQRVVLRDALGNVVDELDCFSSGKWFAGNNQTKQTMERKSGVRPGSDPLNWQTSQNPGGTPKAKNSLLEKPESPDEFSPPEAEITPTELEQEKKESAEARPPQDYPRGIVFNEILPSPEGPDEENEWIEIFNQNEFEVNLSNWQLADSEGKITTYTFPEGTKISPQRFLVLSRPTTKITLNNDGDGLNLVQPDGKTADSVNYEKAPSGQSYNRIPLESSNEDLTGQASSGSRATAKGEEEILIFSPWAWSAILTPGSANVIPSQETEEAETLEEAGKIDINTAPLKDLVKIVHIGEARAEELISLRPFYSLDDLTRIRGISDKTFEDIKKQGLAWVDPTLESPKIEESESLEKGLAAVGEQIPRDSKSLYVFLIALAIAIFSGAIILILKRKMKEGCSI